MYVLIRLPVFVQIANFLYIQLFNRFADPYGYMDICLAIFQGADYRGAGEIKKCWEQLISSIHTDAEASGQGHPYELVADNIRRLGHRFNNSEYIFPPSMPFFHPLASTMQF